MTLVYGLTCLRYLLDLFTFPLFLLPHNYIFLPSITQIDLICKCEFEIPLLPLQKTNMEFKHKIYIRLTYKINM